MKPQTASATPSRETLGAERALALFTRPRRTPPAEDERAFLDRARRRTVLYDGLSLAAWQWGSAGPCVLLVHGWESHAGHWRALIERLLGDGFQVVAFDAPAHGQSGGDSTDVVDIGRATLAVAAQLGPVDAVVGHSVGSPAVLYALSQGLRVRGSVHIAGPSSLRRVLDGFARQGRMEDAERWRFQRLVEERIALPLDDMELPALQRGLLHRGLILHDPHDPEVPYAASEALHRVWPTSTLLPLEGPGHRRIIRDPAALDAIADFLARTATDGRASA